jgi:hypothetical protein
MLTYAENYVVLHIFMKLIFVKYNRFFFIKNKIFARTVYLCFSCSIHFIMVIFYALHFLKKLCYLSEIRSSPIRN